MISKTWNRYARIKLKVYTYFLREGKMKSNCQNFIFIYLVKPKFGRTFEIFNIQRPSF